MTLYRSGYSLFAVLVLGLFAASLSIGFFAPVYFDDLGHIIGCSRIGYDGWLSISNQPLCYSSFATPVPVLLLPGRWLSWFIHSLTDGFILLRLSGLLIFAAWFALALWLVRQVFLPQLPPLYAGALLAALCGLGLAPMVLLQGRPEAAMLLCLTLYIALPVWLRAYSPQPWALWGSGMAFTLMGSWFFSAHSKSIFYLPLVLACCWQLPFSRRFRLGQCVFLILIAMQSLLFWMKKISCSSAKVTAFRQKQALSPELLLNHPTIFWHRLIDNLEHSYYYFTKIGFHPPQYWTTYIPRQWWMAYINLLIDTAGMALVLLVISSMPVMAIHWLRRKRQVTPYDGVIFFLLAGLLAQDGIQVFKSFYESTLVWPLFLLLAGFAATLPSLSQFLHRWRHLWLGGIWAIAAVSMAAFISAYLPATYRLMKQAPDDRILMNKSHAIAPVYYDTVAQRSVALAERCGIFPDARSHGVVVDSVTYFALRKTHFPLYQPFYHDPGSLEELYQIIRHYDSDGLVTACRHLPPSLKKDAFRDRGICCLPKRYFLNKSQ